MSTRRSLLDEMGNIDATPGTRDWAIGVLRDAQSTLNDANARATHLRDLVTLLKQHNAHQVIPGRDGHPFMTWDQFCSTPYPWGLGITPESSDAILSASNGVTVGALLGTHGGDRRSEQARQDQGYNVTLKRGNGTEYLRARLERDHPDIVERLDAGEIASVCQAAIEAGIVKQRIQIPTGDATKAARAILRHFKGESLEQLIRALKLEADA